MILFQKLLYHIAVCFIWLGLAFASLFNKKARLLFRGSARAMAQLSNWRLTHPNIPVVWFHAASLGEFEQARPVIEAYKAAFPQWKVVLTFFSPSGYEIRKNTPVADLISYLPPDLPWITQAYHREMKAQVVFFVKYDFWINHLASAKANGAKLYCLSATFHPSHVYFRPWALVYKRMLMDFDLLMLQNQASSDVLSKAGLSNYHITGDTRFDRVAMLPVSVAPLPELATWTKEQPTLVVGSSWPQDIDALQLVFEDSTLFSRIIIAPHDVSEASIHQLITQLKGNKYTLFSRFSTDSRICIIDSIGKLNSAYAYASVAYVGGAFKQGLHNILEPAAFSKPVLFGPLIDKYPEAMEMIKAGAAKIVSDPKDCLESMKLMLADAGYGKRAGTFISEQTGATEKVMQLLSNSAR